MRTFLAIIGGIVAGVISIGIIQYIGHAVCPVGADFDSTNIEQVAMKMDQIPLGAKLFVLLAWAIGSLVGGFTATNIAQKNALIAAMITGAVLLFFGILNMIMLPHPFWFWIAAIVVFMPLAWLGHKSAYR
jgi:hypothetical protein